MRVWLDSADRIMHEKKRIAEFEQQHGEITEIKEQT
jgi:hypothetical protein